MSINMKSFIKLIEEILKTTMTIHKTFPELSEFLAEMPVTIPDQASPEINSRILEDYLNSLKNLLITYGKNHRI